MWGGGKAFSQTRIECDANSKSLDAQRLADTGSISLWQNAGRNSYQEWIVRNEPGDKVAIVSAATGKCLDADSSRVTQDFCPVATAPDVGNDNQRWTLKPLADGTKSIINVASGKCLAADVARLSHDGCAVFLFNYSDLPNARWRLIATGNSWPAQSSTSSNNSTPNSTSKPQIPNVMGFWTGTVTFDPPGIGSASLYFRITKQNGGVLEYLSIGTGAGSVNSQGEIRLIRNNPPERDEILGHVNGDVMRGRWKTETGTVTSHGSFEVHRTQP
jgi:hypothetical protein